MEGRKGESGNEETTLLRKLTLCAFTPFCQLLASEETLCIESFDAAWKIISSLSNTQLTFWPNLKAFVHFVFNHEILSIAAKLKGQAYFKIKEVTFLFAFVWSVGQEKRGASNQVLGLLLLFSECVPV